MGGGMGDLGVDGEEVSGYFGGVSLFLQIEISIC